MKKFFLTLALAAICSVTMMAQNSYSNIVNRFSHESGVDCVSVGPLMMGLCSLFIDEDDEDAKFVKGIERINIISLDGCSESVKDDFRKMAGNIDPKDLELLMEVNDNSDIMKIFVKKSSKSIRQFLLVNVGSDPCMVNICGNIDVKDVDKLVAQNR